MPIGPGTQLGPYEITARIGSGGMGEVFKALDPKLDRFVAIKVLSESWRQDPSFLARFEREAKVLASLNHPNIVSIFDFGEVDGRSFAVMELLEGRTLREAIKAGPLPLAQAAGIGAEVARGLSAAHRAGIIHRDLKPENIFLTSGGQVKLLDFGLAKKILTRSNGPGQEEAEVRPTSTNAGVLMGTVGYMAPEQLQSDGEVDGRSDLFALGCVLYEMVVGAKAFASETPMGTLHAILTQDPDFGRSELPAALQEVLRHCLAKAPGQRFQDAQDLSYALETFQRPLALVVAMFAIQRFWASRPPLPAFTPLSPFNGQIFAARFDGQGGAVFALRQGDETTQVIHAEAGGEESAMPGLQGLVPLCPEADGSWLVLRGTRHLELGQEILEGDLLRQAKAGGPLQPVSDGVSGADAARDGTLIAVIRHVGGRYRLEAPLGRVRAESEGRLETPRISPSRRWLAYIDRSGDGSGGAVGLVDLQSGARQNLSGGWRDLQGLAWSPGGEIWFTAARTDGPRALYSISTRGKVRPLLSGPESMTILDVSAGGQALICQEYASRAVITRGVTGDPTQVEGIDPKLLGLSYDGRWAVVASPGNASVEKIFRVQIGQNAEPIGAADLAAPSPDGSRVAFASRQGSGWRLSLWSRSGTTALPTKDFSDLRQIAWAPDGASLFLSGATGAGGFRVWRMGADGSGLKAACPEGISSDFPFLVSPDGKWLLAQAGPLLTRFSLEDAKTLPRSVPGLSPGEHLLGWGGDSNHVLVTGPRLPFVSALLDLTDGSRQAASPIAAYGHAGALIDAALSAQGGEAYAIGCQELRSRLFLVNGLR